MSLEHVFSVCNEGSELLKLIVTSTTKLTVILADWIFVFGARKKCSHKTKGNTKSVRDNCRRISLDGTDVEMKAWVGVVLILSLKCCFEKCAAETSLVEKTMNESSDLTRRRLSIDDVTSLLITDAHTAYGSHRLKNEVSSDLWNAAVDYEWARARELESTAQKIAGALRRTTAASGTFPYLVCDEEPGKTGERCRATVEQHFGFELTVSCVRVGEISWSCVFS